MSGESIDTAEDDIEVQLEVTEEQPGGETSGKPAEIAPEEGIEELRAKLAEERAARERAQQEAQQFRSVATHSLREKEEGDIALINSAITQVKQTSEALEDEYAKAMESGDFRGAAKVQTRMAENVNNLKQLEMGLDALTQQRQQPQQQRQPVREAPRTEDPVEKVAATLTPRSADWVRKHPEYVTDPKKQNKMVAAHYAAMAEGHEVDSTDYFRFVESTLGVNDTPAPRQTTSRPAPPPPAPARGSSTQNTRTITLSPQQREMARISGLTDQEYAANLAKARASGEIS